MVSECLSAFVRHLDIAIRDSHGIHRMMVMDHQRLLRRLGVEDAHGYLLAPFRSFLLQIGFHILKPYGISVCLSGTDPARNDAVLQHPRRLSFADVEHFIKLLQGDFSVLQHLSSPPRHRQGAYQASCPSRRFAHCSRTLPAASQGKEKVYISELCGFRK